MANLVTESNADTGTEPFLWYAIASDLGLRAWDWPQQLDTELGNGQPFIKEREQRDAEGELMYMVYKQGNGCLTLRVYND